MKINQPKLIDPDGDFHYIIKYQSKNGDTLKKGIEHGPKNKTIIRKFYDE
jgi:hypothetical protein